ncbi:accessory Sec system translocase SecA2 [Heyndrickxia sporothermodurans]|uniref:Protein translocase subunit SecA n=1 Tax=Heyndrickxia sporothermodurans TaxID=46224 RepID=A0AB37HNK1_9BACI|nr:accessory Sec system translocase SecA2 [Heyndrickxia sporothermodurans]MBL5766682.1 accessory Sec system translocase SecA2 [Heyndrickxia sporothermodurans]MBL5770142.1 accessory Sec system translocase SecA2 [Heyndrickxia sporothermodurans]MBL5774257.1 accessory Sec system translocase SecA2 [Heyndrickxia sporothermodurans]MBL5777775.1 accessory Sec system translocase SecA2 [Heyndrickxia sporothermodurans]MBL5784509.1 accessory Sec system translocase SecA2 [Heyndrickxia sporothermodurans]
MITLLNKTQERKIKKYQKFVTEINRLEIEFEQLSDQELKQKTTYFKELLSNGKTIEDIKVEAFATVREASKRTLGMRHFDVQLIGGLALLEGNISEMPTGEGKSLVASLPSYVRALEGKGVHVITVNEYLAMRDKEQIGQIHEFLGLTVGINLTEMSPDEKQEAYQADITYGIGTEFGFDYLRDHMILDEELKVQRPYHFAIIDEVDSILIDEAKTPLIIANKASLYSKLFSVCSKVVRRMENDVDYTIDLEARTAFFTEEGINKIEKAFSIDNLYDLKHQVLYHYMIQSLYAEVIFKKDVDYIVHEGKIELIDSFTGRVMEGRSLSDGLHQAIEAKEELELTEENKMQATITIQNYFRMYPILSGMTGTAKLEEKEFQQVYGMDVVQIPTNKPKQRIDLEDLIFATIPQKYEALTKEVLKRHATGQPILIGTTSIEQSEMVAKYLEHAKLPYNLLNAKSVEQEVDLISKAGQKNQITIATNMAGRGTDIVLGPGVAELGGLCVLGTERHESRRVDDQLKGRAGRQGDPGVSQFFISIEDVITERFAAEQLKKMKKSLKTNSDGLILNRKIHEIVNRAQRLCEGSNYSAREYTLKLDDVVNEQRNIIYKNRDMILESTDVFDFIIKTYRSLAEYYKQKYTSNDGLTNEKIEELMHKAQLISIKEFDTAEIIEPNEFINVFLLHLEESIEKLKEIYQSEPNFLLDVKYDILHAMDMYWTQHLESMTRLKEGIGLRGYSQEDPIQIYQKESLKIFTQTFYLIEEEICTIVSDHVKTFLLLGEVNE